MEENNFFQFSIFKKFPEIIQGISTRSYGNMVFGKISPQEVVNNRQQFFKDLGIDINQVVVANLIHGNKITNISIQEKGRGVTDPQSAIRKSDGLITTKSGIFLMITVYDCLPIFIYDPIVKVVALIHAGWRGIIEQIVNQVSEKFKNSGSNLENLIIGIGPGICQKHFIVKNDCLDQFKEFYPKAILIRNHDGYVSLKQAILIDLNKAGILKNNIEVSNDCPFCLNNIYGSFRKEGALAPASAAVMGMR